MLVRNLSYLKKVTEEKSAEKEALEEVPENASISSSDGPELGPPTVRKMPSKYDNYVVYVAACHPIHEQDA